MGNPLCLFDIPWAYLQKQSAGTFRLSPLWGDDTAFDHPRWTTADGQSGVYVFLGRPIRLNLVWSDTDLRNIYLPNGKPNKDGFFETLCFVSNETKRVKAPNEWLEHPDVVAIEAARGLSAAEPRSKPRLVEREEPATARPKQSPAARNQDVRSSNTLPIRLHPPGAAFKEELLRTREAWIATFYENGGVQVRHWDASRMSETSNVLGNLRSRPEHRNPRWRELGIAAVQVTIDPVAALGRDSVEQDQGWFDLPTAFDRYVLSDASVKLRIGEHGKADAASRCIGGRYGHLRVDGGGALREWFASTGSARGTLIVRVEARDLLVLDWVQRPDSDAPRATPNLVLMSGN